MIVLYKPRLKNTETPMIGAIRIAHATSGIDGKKENIGRDLVGENSIIWSKEEMGASSLRENDTHNDKYSRTISTNTKTRSFADLGSDIKNLEIWVNLSIRPRF